MWQYIPSVILAFSFSLFATGLGYQISSGLKKNQGNTEKINWYKGRYNALYSIAFAITVSNTFLSMLLD